MPGVLRPNTLIDLLGQINGQAQTSTDTSTGAAATAFGQIAEVSEQITAVDSASGVVRAVAGWDQEVWGASTWG
jgi:hypothetical protein